MPLLQMRDGSTHVTQSLDVRPQPTLHTQPPAAGPVVRTAESDREITTVLIALLVPGESPRLEGQDEEHVARLAEIDAPLPPILVDRRSMQVIDGTHRLMAAILRGRATIEVEFFDGNPADAFLHAVKANVTHGFPLSRPTGAPPRPGSSPATPTCRTGRSRRSPDWPRRPWPPSAAARTTRWPA